MHYSDAINSRNRDKVQIVENSFTARCDIYACLAIADVLILRPDGPLNLAFGLCSKHLKELEEAIKGKEEIEVGETEVHDTPEEVVEKRLDEVEMKIERIRSKFEGGNRRGRRGA